MLKGMALAIVLVVTKLFVEATPFGAWAEQQTREMLLKLLPSFRTEGLDAVVIDISHFAAGEPDPKDGHLIPTSRTKLTELLKALVKLGPVAIGIDVDFSTHGEGWLDAHDPDFFDQCLELNERVPVRLGVWRSIPDPSGIWLDAPEYTPLAAALLVTDSKSGRLPVLTMPPDSEKRLPSLGAALVAAIPSSRLEVLGERNESALERFIFEDIVERRLSLPMKTLSVRTFEAPVNYSVVPQMAREYIARAEAADLPRYAERIRGRVVLIGAAQKTSDVFKMPGLDKHYPGVFLHAAQVHTLSSEHLREFSHHFRLVLDLLIAFCLLSTMVLWRWLVSRSRSPSTQAPPALTVVLAGSGLVLLFGFSLVASYGIFWLDFLLVILFTLLHWWAEHKLLSHTAR